VAGADHRGGNAHAPRGQRSTKPTSTHSRRLGPAEATTPRGRVGRRPPSRWPRFAGDDPEQPAAPAAPRRSGRRGARCCHHRAAPDGRQTRSATKTGGVGAALPGKRRCCPKPRPPAPNAPHTSPAIPRPARPTDRAAPLRVTSAGSAPALDVWMPATAERPSVPPVSSVFCRSSGQSYHAGCPVAADVPQRPGSRAGTCASRSRLIGSGEPSTEGARAWLQYRPRGGVC
jgi:hypothetical protein